jgi:hypothetical protein
MKQILTTLLMLAAMTPFALVAYWGMEMLALRGG